MARTSAVVVVGSVEQLRAAIERGIVAADWIGIVWPETGGFDCRECIERPGYPGYWEYLETAGFGAIRGIVLADKYNRAAIVSERCDHPGHVK